MRDENTITLTFTRDEIDSLEAGRRFVEFATLEHFVSHYALAAAWRFEEHLRNSRSEILGLLANDAAEAGID